MTTTPTRQKETERRIAMLESNDTEKPNNWEEQTLPDGSKRMIRSLNRSERDELWKMCQESENEPGKVVPLVMEKDGQRLDWTSIIISAAAILVSSVALYSSCNAKRIKDKVNAQPPTPQVSDVVPAAPVIQKKVSKRR